MNENRAVVAVVGDAACAVPAAKTVRVPVVSADKPAVVDAVRGCGLAVTDVRNPVLVVVDDASPVSVAAYAALVGFVGRRLPVLVAGTRVAPHQVTQLARASLAAAGEPSAAPEVLVQVGGPDRDDVVVFPFGPDALVAARTAKRVRFVAPADPVEAFVQLLALAAVRERDGVERFPYLCAGDEPVGDDPKAVAGLDIDGIRRAALSMRRTVRVDDRSTLVAAEPVDDRNARLAAAAAVDVTVVLPRLGAVPEPDAEPGVVSVWSCPRSRAHQSVPATGALRVFDTNKVHCGRCDLEKIDTLRLVMAATRLTADEAADFILGA